MEFMGKIELLNIYNLLCRKFSAVCRKIATSWPSIFVTHDAAGQKTIGLHVINLGPINDDVCPTLGQSAFFRLPRARVPRCHSRSRLSWL